MKIRTDFVTNSSSSSFIVLHKVNRCKELDQYMKEEYGNYGLRLLDELLHPLDKYKYTYHYNGKDRSVYEFEDCEFEPSDLADIGIDPEDKDSLYLAARFYTWTTEGDTNGDDAWLSEKLPAKYCQIIYESQPD